NDRFSQSRTFSVPTSFPNPLRFTSVSYFTNDFNTRTRGIDATARYRWRLGQDQKLDLSAGFNLSDTRITHIKATPAVLAG
ncbi:hypothetical protein INQ29_24915, partial [Escherichia coli]|nr:hypothetical protein [Escherichia coli]